MSRSMRLAIITIAILVATNGLNQVLAAPQRLTSMPRILSLPVSGWQPSSIVSGSHDYSGEKKATTRLVQDYYSAQFGTATVETRCEVDPKSFLKWTGRLGYQGAGYEQLQMESRDLSTNVPASKTGAVVSGSYTYALMRKQGQSVVIDYTYIDHWGVNAQSYLMWPRVMLDLITRHGGNYCSLGVVMPVQTTPEKAQQGALQLLTPFIATLDKAV